MYVYKQSEPGLWTVGYYEPSSEHAVTVYTWIPESDHNSTKNAAARVNYLNGGTGERP